MFTVYMRSHRGPKCWITCAFKTLASLLILFIPRPQILPVAHTKVEDTEVIFDIWWLRCVRVNSVGRVSLHCSGFDIQFTNTVKSESLKWCNMIFKGAVFDVALAQFYTALTFKLILCCFAGTEGERPAAAHHKNRRLPHDFSDCDGSLGCSYQASVVVAVVRSVFFTSTRRRVKLWLLLFFFFFRSQAFSSDWTHRRLPCSPQSGLYHISEIALCSGNIFF